MNEATKKKISKSMKKYHRCAAKHRCGRKKKSDNMSIADMLKAQGKWKGKKGKKKK